MNDNQSPQNNSELDDSLARFTDELLSGRTPSVAQDSEDSELQQLETTLRRLKTLVDTDNPKPELASLLEVRLKRAWEEHQQRQQQQKHGLISLLAGWLRRPTPLLQFSAVVFVILLAVVALLPGELPLQGAAGAAISSMLPWIASIGLVVILIILIWTYRKK